MAASRILRMRQFPAHWCVSALGVSALGHVGLGSDQIETESARADHSSELQECRQLHSQPFSRRPGLLAFTAWPPSLHTRVTALQGSQMTPQILVCFIRASPTKPMVMRRYEIKVKVLDDCKSTAADEGGSQAILQHGPSNAKSQITRSMRS